MNASLPPSGDQASAENWHGPDGHATSCVTAPAIVRSVIFETGGAEAPGAGSVLSTSASVAPFGASETFEKPCRRGASGVAAGRAGCAWTTAPGTKHAKRAAQMSGRIIRAASTRKKTSF
jgi:hypothetical protein